MSKPTPKTYLPGETTKMAAQGYITPRAAADLVHVRIDRVYRAIKAEVIRFKIGDNAWTRYVHKGDWLKLMDKVRAKAKAELGLP